MGAGSGGQGGSNGFFKSQETSPEVSGQIGVTPEVSSEEGWVDEAAEIGAPRRHSRGGMSPRTSGGEGEWTQSRGIVSYKTIWVCSSKLRIDVVSCSMFCIFFQLKYL